MSAPKTLSPGTLNVTLSGHINAYGAVGTYIGETWDAAVIGSAATHFTVHNCGTILSHTTTFSDTDAGIILGAFGTVFNSGTIIGAAGIEIFGTAGTSALANTGKIFGTCNLGVYSADFTDITNANAIYGTGRGVVLYAGGFVQNAANATIAASDSNFISAAIFSGGVAIANAGTLRNVAACIDLRDGGTVDNTGLILQTLPDCSYGAIQSYRDATVSNAGLIAGGNGIKLAKFGVSNYDGFISNAGTIDAFSTFDLNSNVTSGFLEFGIAVDLVAGGTGEVTNTNTIAGNHAGIVFKHAPGTVINHLIVSASQGYGVYLNAGGTVTNTGTIYGFSQGIFAGGGSVTNFITNSGDIQALKAPVSLAGGTYHGGAIVDHGGAIINSGTVSDPNGAGIDLIGSLAGTIINTGTITGGTGGILLNAGGTIINTGTIIGTSYAIAFATGSSNRLIIGALSDIIGAVNGGGGVIELANDGTATGTLTTAEQAQFANFSSLQIDPGAVWDFAGNVTIAGPNLLNNGTIKESASDKLTINSALTGTGTVDLSKKPLTLNGSAASTQNISFTGTGESLDLTDPTAFKAKIEKFKPTDSIDLTTVKFADIVGTSFAKSVLTIITNTETLHLAFASPSAFGKDTFQLFADGAGTGITLAPAALSGSLPHHLATSGTTPAPLITFSP